MTKILAMTKQCTLRTLRPNDSVTPGERRVEHVNLRGLLNEISFEIEI